MGSSVVAIDLSVITQGGDKNYLGELMNEIEKGNVEQIWFTFHFRIVSGAKMFAVLWGNLKISTIICIKKLLAGLRLTLRDWSIFFALEDFWVRNGSG